MIKKDLMKGNEIIQYIANRIAPDSTEIDDANSLYYTSDMGVVTRVANHRAYHRTFQKRITKFGLPSKILSIVFEDEPTEGNNILDKPRKKPFTIHEYVYPLWKQGHTLEKWEVDKIVRAIIASGGGSFNDVTNKSEYIPRESQNSKISNNTEEQDNITSESKTHKNMNKKIIKINESQLRNMVSESVKKVLKEHFAPEGGYSDYEGQDMSYESIYEEAQFFLDKARKEGVNIQDATSLAEYMGYKPNSFNETDWETVHDAIEDAMAEDSYPDDFKLSNVVAESVKKALNEGSNYDKLKTLFYKLFSSLNDEEKKFLYNELNNNTWDVIYAALSALHP